MIEQGFSGNPIALQRGVAISRPARAPAPKVSVRLLRNMTAIAATGTERVAWAGTMAIPREKTLLIAIAIKGRSVGQASIEAQSARSCPQGCHIAGMIDLDRDDGIYVPQDGDSLEFRVPLRMLDAIADRHGAPRGMAFSCPDGVADPVVGHLVSSLLPVLDSPDVANALFVAEVANALVNHIAYTYGGMSAAPSFCRGGLAPWQLRRAKEFMEANLDGDVSLAEVASQCKLSRSHFARAFRQATGLPPHRWLLEHRTNRAKTLLLETGRTLSEVAKECGFADQSHFTRVFADVVGMSPGAWRRARRN